MSFAFGLLAVMLKGTLAEAAAFLFAGCVFVAAVIGVSYGLERIGFAVVLEASVLGMVGTSGILLGMAAGYTYWSRKWRQLLKGRAFFQRHPKNCLCECEG